MLLDCGVGEDSWESLRLQGDPTSESGGERDDRGWDGWMASLTQWTCIWVSSRSWWWTGRPGVLQFMGSQRVEYDWATELNWERMQALPADSTEFRVWVLAFSAGKMRVRKEAGSCSPYSRCPLTVALQIAWPGPGGKAHPLPTRLCSLGIYSLCCMPEPNTIL